MNELLYKAMDIIDDGVIIIDESLKVIYANKAIEKLSGKTK
jgi:PAS fold.